MFQKVKILIKKRKILANHVSKYPHTGKLKIVSSLRAIKI